MCGTNCIFIKLTFCNACLRGLCLNLRTYPPDYGRAVAVAFRDHSTVDPPPLSAAAAPERTDREIFDELVRTTTDLWDDVGR